jgi:hypothetical protein
MTTTTEYNSSRSSSSRRRVRRRRVRTHADTGQRSTKTTPLGVLHVLFGTVLPVVPCWIRSLCIVVLFVLVGFNLVYTLLLHPQQLQNDHNQHHHSHGRKSAQLGGLELQKRHDKKVTLESLRGDLTENELDYVEDHQHLDSMPQITTNITWKEASKGKEPILALLRDAGIQDIDIRVVQLLPTWNQVEALYGKNGPILEGLAQCDFFRNNYGGKVWGIAGMFDSGTNLAANYLESNCIMPSTSTDKDSFDILWEVPWGKHVPAEMRNHKSYRRNDKSKDDATSSVMPIVMIRDPYFWMQSMCHHNYGARWFHSTDHCPNLVPNKWDKSYRAGPNPGTIPVRIKYDFGWREWDSLAHLWTNWYQQYHKEADYPRILVRYEDMIFYPKEVTRQLCEVCAGGTLRQDFSYQVDSAKQGPGHGDVRTSWITAIIRYGSDRWRLRGLTKEDLLLAKEALDITMMQAFSYQQPATSTSPAASAG